MALPKQIGDFLDKNGDALQNLALLAYLKNGEDSKHYLEAITTMKVCQDVYKRLSREDEIEKARTEAILNISAFVKANPRARPQQIQAKVEEEIQIFKSKIE